MNSIFSSKKTKNKGTLNNNTFLAIQVIAQFKSSLNRRRASAIQRLQPLKQARPLEDNHSKIAMVKDSTPKIYFFWKTTTTCHQHSGKPRRTSRHRQTLKLSELTSRLLYIFEYHLIKTIQTPLHSHHDKTI